MFQLLIARVNGIASGNEHHPKAVSQIVLLLAQNFFQTAANAIANNRTSYAT